MRIGICGPFSTAALADAIGNDSKLLPAGMPEARVTSRLAVQLVQHGYEVALYGLDGSIAAPEKHVLGALTLYLAPYRRTRAVLSDVYKQERVHLQAFMRDDAPDIVHAHWTYQHAVAAIGSDLPCLVTVHDSPTAVFAHDPGVLRAARALMGHRVLRSARFLTAVSPYIAVVVKRATDRPCWVVPNGVEPVPPSLRFPEPRELGSKFRVITVAAGPARLKNAALAVRALGVIARQANAAILERITMEIVGVDATTRKRIDDLALHLGVATQVRVRGRIDHTQLLELIGSADAMLHTSREESFGLAIAESMAVGTPVIAGSGVGAIPWLLDGGRCGVLVDLKSPENVAAAMLDLFHDVAEWRRLSSVSITRVRSSFSEWGSAQRYLGLYEKVQHAWSL